MKFVRSDSPEVIRGIASARAMACWGWFALPLAFASVLVLLISIVLARLFLCGLWSG